MEELAHPAEVQIFWATTGQWKEASGHELALDTCSLKVSGNLSVVLLGISYGLV